MKLVAEMDDEAQRHVREGLTEEELAFFDILTKDNISKAARERVKQASKGLLTTLKEQLATMPAWTKNTTTQADVKVLILDTLYASLPRPPFTDDEAEALAERLYGFVWQQSEMAA
jgi:type I restriction enzyme R subunit